MSAARARKAPASEPGSQAMELAEAAAAGRLPRLLLLLPPERGEDEPWFSERILAAARAHARAQPGWDVLDLDGGSPDFQPAALDDFLGSASLFGNQRVVLFGRAGKALGRWPRLAAALAAAAQRPPGPAWIVVHAEGAAGAKTWKPLLAQLEGESVRVQRFRRLYADPPPWNPDPDQSEAARFAAAAAGARGLTLLPGAAGALVQFAGARPGDLVAALEHMGLLGLAQVGEEDVHRVVAHGAEGSAFEFAEAVLTGDVAAALRCLGRLRSRGLRAWDGRRLAAQDAFGMLASVLATERRRTAAVRAALDSGAELADACRSAGVPAGGPPAQRMHKRLARCDGARLRRIGAALRAAERRVKMEGCRDALAALELLLVQTLPPPAARRSPA
ncbi:MAG: hypothetical protein EYC70_14975 [Planctomycetota bacterium]|nr:MAG: hypothetical protein EYC70_14975 [Planctomycetota bacterium]